MRSGSVEYIRTTTGRGVDRNAGAPTKYTAAAIATATIAAPTSHRRPTPRAGGAGVVLSVASANASVTSPVARQRSAGFFARQRRITRSSAEDTPLMEGGSVFSTDATISAWFSPVNAGCPA